MWCRQYDGCSHLKKQWLQIVVLLTISENRRCACRREYSIASLLPSFLFVLLPFLGHLEHAKLLISLHYVSYHIAPHIQVHRPFTSLSYHFMFNARVCFFSSKFIFHFPGFRIDDNTIVALTLTTTPHCYWRNGLPKMESRSHPGCFHWSTNISWWRSTVEKPVGWMPFWAFPPWTKQRLQQHNTLKVTCSQSFANWCSKQTYTQTCSTLVSNFETNDQQSTNYHCKQHNEFQFIAGWVTAWLKSKQPQCFNRTYIIRIIWIELNWIGLNWTYGNNKCVIVNLL